MYLMAFDVGELRGYQIGCPRKRCIGWPLVFLRAAAAGQRNGTRKHTGLSCQNWCHCVNASFAAICLPAARLLYPVAGFQSPKARRGPELFDYGVKWRL